MKNFYFTYGTDRSYPFYGGWTRIYAPDIKAAAQIFKAYHPNIDDSSILNCSDYYSEEEFKSSDMYKNGNFGYRCHEMIEPIYYEYNEIEKEREE